MTTMTFKGAKGEGDFFRLHFWGAVLLVLGALLALGALPAHAAPLAGTSIGNQASASYTDANAVARITVSNSVSTVVQAVGSANLVQSQTKVGAPGQTLSFPHTIYNTGNSPDSFVVTVGTIVNGATFNPAPSAASLFADANCDGQADNNTAITTVGPVAPGGQGCFVAQVTLASSGVAASFNVGYNSGIASSTLQANSVAGSFVTDNVSISNNAVINVTKSIDIATGPSGTIATYTLTYRNTGTVSAGSVVIADTLPSNAGYILSSATWSGLVSTTLTDIETDTQGTSPNSIDFGLVGGVGGTTVGGTVYAILERVDPGVQGTIQFRAQLTGTGPLTIENFANWCYSDIGTGGTVLPAATATACNNIRASFGAGSAALANFTGANGVTTATNTNKSNIVPFFVPSVGATGSVVYNDANAALSGTTGLGNATTNADGTNPMVTLVQAQALNDSDANIAVATAGQGTIATWDTSVWNTGSGTDTFNIYPPTAGATVSNFPSGTTFLLFRNDNFTPLTDSNNDGVVDTGPVANGSRYVVRVVAILPPSGAAGTYDAVLTAQSTNTTSATNTVGVRLRIVSSRVDLRNNPFTGVSASDGTNQTTAGEGAAVTGGQVSANPSTNAAFRLSVENTGSIPDSFNLSWNATSGAYTVADAFTTPTALPSGFTMKFYRTVGNVTTCATTDLGAEVSNTGVIQPGAANRQNYCAIVSVPAGATAATYELFFRALSPTTWVAPASTTGAADVLHNQLNINQVRSAAISPNNSGQGFPGGSVQYCHTVTNSGNTAETGLSVTQANQSLNGTTGWGQYATIYRDSNDNCVLDGTENTTPVTTPLTLGTVTAGASVRFIVVVQVPGAAVAGQTNVNTFTLTSSDGATISQATAADTTTVVLGQISLVKDQLLDAACNTTFDAATLDGLTYAQTQITTGAVPGACIIYRVRATNVGTQTVTAVTINDVAPPNTTRHATAISGATNACTPGAPAAPNVNCAIATLTGGSTTTMYFRVRIDP